MIVAGERTEPDQATIEFILGWTREGISRQIADHDSIERRLMHALASAGVVVGLAGVSSLGRATHAEIAMLIAIIFSFACVAAAAAAGSWTRRYRFVDYGDSLWATCHDWTANEIRHFLASKVPAVIAHNREIGQAKGKCLRWALIFTGTEVVLVGILLLLRASH